MVQRKFRNLEEREKICQEISDKLSEIGITRNIIPYLEEFFKILSDFLKNTDNGKYFTGTFKIQDLGLEIEYNLQGRRILPCFSRIKKIQINP